MANALAFAWGGWLGLGLLPLTFWVAAFFRDPERSPGGNGILSPADGRILPLVRAVAPPELGLGPLPRLKISIFMSIFDVHVNRIPYDGTVTALAYRPGKFFNASFDKASLYNERMSIRMAVEGGKGAQMDIGVVQIAGLIARRIECGLQEGQKVCRGDRFGIIRFGSRLELFVPDGFRMVAQEGQRVRAGQTVLAEFPS
ncbi:MAG TPA: phosphatidylserine decarboxylase [Rhizomicrobium sp.]|jgi:phosphatidylserine decarboxylase|nr:phosphatidylserine decarboxylase [Rhizomicrobium sp.]